MFLVVDSMERSPKMDDGMQKSTDWAGDFIVLSARKYEMSTT